MADLRTLIKAAIKHADDVGRSRGSNCYAHNTAAVVALVDMNDPIEAALSKLEADAQRLDFLCNAGKDRFVQEEGGLWRVYQDEADGDQKHQFWQAMHPHHCTTPREAIDMARAWNSSRGQGGS